jgi:hypothetical protein
LGLLTIYGARIIDWSSALVCIDFRDLAGDRVNALVVWAAVTIVRIQLSPGGLAAASSPRLGRAQEYNRGRRASDSIGDEVSNPGVVHGCVSIALR